MKRSAPYHDLLIASLKDPKEAVAYLNEALHEYGMLPNEESRKVLLNALRNVAEAQGGLATLSQKTGLGRESLYKTLSSRGNPKLSTITNLVHAMGFDLQFSLRKKGASPLS